MNIGLILSGGVGTRLGSKRPKQYLEVNGKLVLSYCLKAFFEHEEIDAVQIAACEQWHPLIKEQISRLGKTYQVKFRGFSKPGGNRQLSILNGLEDIRGYAGKTDYVVIHDGVRPMVTGKHISACLNAASGHDGAVLVCPMKDTVYLGERGKITSLPDRSCLYAGQSPECFVLEAYYGANVRLLPDKIDTITGSTQPAVLAGLDIVMAEGDEMNFKITTKEDLERFRKMEEGR